MRVLYALVVLALSGVLYVNSHAQSGPCPGGLPLAFEGAVGPGQCAQGGRGGPVSLPTGASTAAKQPALGTAGTASADVISGNFGPGGVGIGFGTAITVAATTGVADADTGAPAANDVIVNIFYK